MPPNNQRMIPGVVPTMLAAPQPPSAADLAEVKRINGLQLRTEAAKMATAIIASGQVSDLTVVDVARVIAAFIEGSEDANDNDPAPLLS